MIEFQDNSSLPGIPTIDALVFVADLSISSDRTIMNFSVMISAKSLLPLYTPYAQENYVNISYDINSSDNPAMQAYLYLMTLPKYENGTPYP